MAQVPLFTMKHFTNRDTRHLKLTDYTSRTSLKYRLKVTGNRTLVAFCVTARKTLDLRALNAYSSFHL